MRFDTSEVKFGAITFPTFMQDIMLYGKDSFTTLSPTFMRVNLILEDNAPIVFETPFESELNYYTQMIKKALPGSV